MHSQTLTVPPVAVPTATTRTGRPWRRHASDVVRLGVGTAGLAASALVANQGRLSRLETDVFRLLNHLPSQAEPALAVLMQAGALPAAAMASGAALLARRPRMAADTFAAGTGAWLAAKAVKELVGRGRPGSLLDAVVLHGAPAAGLGFPSGHAAVAAALAAAASPHLPRAGRRAAWALAAVVAVSRVYVGAHLPVDVVGGALLGLAIAAAVHLVLGTPVRGVDPDRVAAAVAATGFDAADLRPADGDARGSTTFLATSAAGGRRFVKCIGRDERNADLLFKLWRRLSRRGIEDEAPFATTKQQAEHEALLSLLAHRAGVRTPELRATATTSDRGAVLVFDHLDAVPVDRLDRDIDERVLRDLWSQVALLHGRRLAHRDLRAANVLVDGAGQAWIVDLGFAEAAASPRRRSQDVAELLASTAVLVGADRAVAAAAAVLAPETIGGAVPLLQPMALSAATRRTLRRRRGLLDEVRRTAATAGAVDADQLAPIARVRWQTVVALAVGLVSIHLLLPQVGELRTTLRTLGHADPGLLFAAALLSALSYVAAGVARLGSVNRPLPPWPTVGVQVASSFANRLLPGSIGGAGLNVRYLERTGADRPTAVAATALATAAGVAVHVPLFAIAAAVVGAAGVEQVHLPPEWPWLVATAVLLCAAGLAVPAARRRLLDPARTAARALLDAVRRPRRAALLLGGSLGVTATYVLCLAASLAAFGAGLPLSHVALAFLGGTAVASAAPTPGGIGAVEATLIAALTALGGATAPVVAGVLAFRLVTFWLPTLPGWLAFRALQRRGLL